GHTRELFGIVIQKIRMRNQNVQHRDAYPAISQQWPKPYQMDSAIKCFTAYETCAPLPYTVIVLVALAHSKMERANTALAYEIALDVQRLTKRHGSIGIQNISERTITNISQGCMKKTRTHRAIRFDHARYPRCVAMRFGK